MQEWTGTSENVYVRSYHDETPDRPQDKYYYSKSETYNYPSSENGDRNDDNNNVSPRSTQSGSAQRKFEYPRHYIRNDGDVESGKARKQRNANFEYDYPQLEPRQNSSILSYDYPRPEHHEDSGSAVSKQQDAPVKGLESIPEAEGEPDGYLCPDGHGYLKPASTDEHGYLKPSDSNKTDECLTIVPSTCLDQAEEKTNNVKSISRILNFFRRGKQESDGTHSYDNAGVDNSRIRRRQPGDLHEYDNQIPGHKTYPVS